MNNHLKKGIKVEAIRRYLKMRYNISMSHQAIKERIRMLQMKYELK
jgi:hypothetical protein